MHKAFSCSGVPIRKSSKKAGAKSSDYCTYTYAAQNLCLGFCAACSSFFDFIRGERGRCHSGDDMCGAVLVILRANASVFVTQKEVARSCEHRPRHSFIFVPQRAPHSSRNLGHLEVSRPVVARCFLLICLFVPSYVAKKATRSGTPRTIVEERNSSP